MTGDGAERRAPGSVGSRPSEDAGRWTGGVAVGRCERRREDAETLQDGRRAATAGQQAAASRRGRTSRQLTVMYRPSIRPVARPGSPSPSPGPFLVGP